jgi:hypothetical protein
MIPFNFKSDFMVIVGHKSYGKTYLTRAFCRQIPSFIFIDPKFQATELGYCVHFPDRIAAAFLKWKKVIYQPAKGQETAEAYTLAFNECLRLSNYTLIIDEIDEFAGSKGYMCDAVRELIRRGRLQGIGLIGNSRRPSVFHNDIKGNADHVIMFKLLLYDDREYMEKWVGVNRDVINKLAPYHSIYVNTETYAVVRQKPI